MLIGEDDEEIILKLEPGIDDFIGRRIYHQSFQKIIYWLDFKSKKSDFIYSKELSEFMKITVTRSHQILWDLCNIGLMRKNITGGLVEYWFIRNGNIATISKYVDRARKLLGLG